MEPFIGTVIQFAGNFAPRGWALCDGQLLSINSHSALFSILGTTYGGDGVSTFGLPELRGRVAIHEGTGPGLTPRNLGEKSGQETHTLSKNEMPSHNHTAYFQVDYTGGGTADPTNLYFGGGGQPIFTSDTSNLKKMNAGAIDMVNTGASQAHNNMQPYLALNFIIALEGLYPSRS